MTISKEITVKKSEALIKSKHKLSPLASKMISSIIGAIQGTDTIEQEYCIRTKELSNIMNIKSGRFNEYVKNACLEIMKNPIEISKKGKKDYLICNWASSCEYLADAGVIRFQVSPKLLPFVVDLKENYLKYNLMNILSLKTSGSIRLYEMLKDELNKKDRYAIGKYAYTVITIDELRHMFEIPDGYSYNDIKVQIIELAKNDILQNCDITFDYEIESKIGKAVKSLKFKISKNKKNIKTSQKGEQLPKYLFGIMPFVNHLRELYKGEDSYMTEMSYDLGNGAKRYFFGINSNGNIHAIEKSGGYAINVTKEQSRDIYAACFLCATENKLYRELLNMKIDFWELSRDDEQMELYKRVSNLFL